MQTISKAGTVTLLAVACLTIMVGCVIVPGLTKIAENLGTPAAASWLVTVPSLGVVIFGPLAGWFIDRVGAYKALCGGLALYGALGAGGVFLHGMVPVLIDRLLLGGVTAVVMSAGTSLISTFFSGQARLKMIATQGMSIELGGVIFLFIGGLLATLGWQWPFLLYLVSWLFLGMMFLFVPEPVLRQETSERLDIHVTDDLSRRALTPIYFAALFSMVCFFTAIIIIPQYFHQMDIGAAETGYFLSFISLVAVFAAAAMPKVVAKLHELYTLYLAFICYVLGQLVFALAVSIPVLVIGGAFMGCGFGLSVPLVNHMTVERSHERRRGKNLARLSMAIFSGQFISSFMEFIPGSLAGVFLGTALTGVLVIVVLMCWRQSFYSVTEG